MIYSEQGYIAVVLFGSFPPPPPPPPSVSSTCDKQKERPVRQLLTGEVGEGGGGANSYDGEKAWASINHSILCRLDVA
jgi:hypothetical protein